MERRLAAILAADVVGYSRLMEIDEAGTLAALKAHREELIDPAIAEHRGRLVKLMGDGALVEFASVVDAITCAVAIQEGMAERNASPPERRCCRLSSRRLAQGPRNQAHDLPQDRLGPSRRPSRQRSPWP